MKNLFFKSTMAVGALLLATAFMPVAANAAGHSDCVSGPLCGGTYPTLPSQPANFPNFALRFEGATYGVGNAQTEIVKGVGEVFASRDSGSDIDFEGFLDSGLCVVDCADGGFKASVRSFERVTSGGYAISEGGHGTVAAIKGTNNAFTFGSMDITFPALGN